MIQQEMQSPTFSAFYEIIRPKHRTKADQPAQAPKKGRLEKKHLKLQTAMLGSSCRSIMCIAYCCASALTRADQICTAARLGAVAGGICLLYACWNLSDAAWRATMVRKTRRRLTALDGDLPSGTRICKPRGLKAGKDLSHLAAGRGTRYPATKRKSEAAAGFSLPCSRHRSRKHDRRPKGQSAAAALLNLLAFRPWVRAIAKKYGAAIHPLVLRRLASTFDDVKGDFQLLVTPALLRAWVLES